MGLWVAPDERISATISQDANAEQDEPTIEGNRFSIPLRFDPTRGYGPKGHDCSRDPETITVLLTRGDQVLQKRELKFASEFNLDKKGDYVLKRPLAIDAGSEPPR